MLREGLLNPHINHLLSRIRHTNTLIISDRGFPTIPGVEVVDISLIAGIPCVLDVLSAVLSNFQCNKAVMSEEFRRVQSPEIQSAYEAAFNMIVVNWVPHAEFKGKARDVIGIIRTGDTTRFGNVLLESS
ncbi:D-ribose pyranase [Edaphobacter paludis]|uniref:D-ribose pyranase n=1 Tax=Edaphobacter paludis TaxID=3035702 RepID=UPI0035A0E0E7